MRPTFIDGILDLMTRGELEVLAERVHLRLHPPPSTRLPTDPAAPSRASPVRRRKIDAVDEEIADWWRQKLVDGRLLPGDDAWPSRVFAEDLVEEVQQLPCRLGEPRRGTQAMVGLFLRQACRPRVAKRTRPNPGGGGRGLRSLAYLMPTLEEARAHWLALTGEDLTPRDPPAETSASSGDRPAA